MAQKYFMMNRVYIYIYEIKYNENRRCSHKNILYSTENVIIRLEMFMQIPIFTKTKLEFSSRDLFRR